MKLYHATSQSNAVKIINKGINSHSWFATSKKRALVYAELNVHWKHEGNQVILTFNVPKKEVIDRSLVIQSSEQTQTEYLLHSYKMKKLRPVDKEL